MVCVDGFGRENSAVIELDFFSKSLDRLREEGLFREPDEGSARNESLQRATELGVSPIDASSNDYLGYATTPVSRETNGKPQSAGAGASRLIHGTRPIHRSLENEIAAWVDHPGALLFSSGYAANIGVIGALAQPGDIIISDALNHASIIDGCRLARAEIAVSAHLDTGAIEAVLCRERHRRQCWVVTESYFSMDGDSPDLVQLRAMCDEYRAPLIVDEAHALGVFGPQGSGLCRQLGLKPDVIVGTFGKAVGAQGAFVGSGPVLRDWLWNRARSFAYSTAMSPLLAHAALNNIQRARNDEAGRSRLLEIVSRFRRSLINANVPVLASSHGPIIPIILGSPKRAMAATSHLISRGILVQAIRPPTVKPGSCRIRLTLNSMLSDEQVSRLANAIIETCAP